MKNYNSVNKGKKISTSLVTGLEVQEKRTKSRWTEKEKMFLNYYAANPVIKENVIKAGLHLNKRTGKPVNDVQILFRGHQLLRYKEAQDYVRALQKEVFDMGVHSLEKAVMESYNDYMDWRVTSKHEANIAFERYCRLLGFLGPNGTSVNTQIITNDDGKGVTINFITPEEHKKNNDDE